MVVLLASSDPGTISVDGLLIPDAGAVFLTALAVHVLAGVVCVAAGAVAAFARKRPGRHPRAGTVYVAGLAVLVCTAGVMALVRWDEDRHLFVIACLAGTLGAAGWWARRSWPPRWMRWHGFAMAGSYIALLTGFYVDNGPQLPVWEHLPPMLYWVLPALVGVPLTWWALRRNGAVGRLSWRRGASRSAGR